MILSPNYIVFGSVQVSNFSRHKFIKTRKLEGHCSKLKKTSDLEHTLLRLFPTQKHLFISQFHPLKITTSLTQAVTRKLFFILSFISVNVPYSTKIAMGLGKSRSVCNYFEKFTVGPCKKHSTSRFYTQSLTNLSPSFFVLNQHLNVKKLNTCRSNTCARCTIVRTLCASNQVANNLNNSMNHSAVFLHYLAYETVYVFVKTFSM